MKEKIARLSILCKKGAEKGLTQEEHKEFKKLEKQIFNAMMRDEKVFDDNAKAFRKATQPLLIN